MEFLLTTTQPAYFGSVFVTASLVAFFCSAMVAWLLLLTRSLHIRWTGDHPHGGPQKLHVEATARVGGVAIALGLLAGLVSVHLSATGGLRTQLLGYQAVWLIAAAAPLFLLGLVEDVSSAVSIRLRLVAALAAGALAWGMGGVRISQLHLPLLDQLLVSIPFFSFCLTVVAVGGLVHAMNIVDGVNGLLAGIALLMLGAVALVAGRFNEPVLLLIAALGMAAALGFVLFNFPKGRLFCGDAGAYLLGYLAAVLLVLLVLEQPALSPWFAMAVVIHPVTETLYSAWRRARSGLSPTAPDVQHMHSLWSARLRVIERSTGRRVTLGTNAGASWRTLAMALVPTVVAIVWPTQTTVLQLLCVAYVVAFILVVQLLSASLHATAQVPSASGASPAPSSPNPAEASNMPIYQAACAPSRAELPG